MFSGAFFMEFYKIINTGEGLHSSRAGVSRGVQRELLSPLLSP
ncbi:hypothetical protein MIDIC_50053 [Alphaproteobacteria bacterium]